MLFVIDSSIAEVLSQPAPNLDVIRAVEAIATACDRGIHLISAKRNILEVLSNTVLLSEPNRRFYNGLYDDFSQIIKFPEMFIRRIEVVAQPNTFELYEEGVCSKVIRLSAQHVTHSSITGEPVLLGENLSDVKLYEHITRVYLSQPNFAHLGLRYEPSNGGGDTTGEVYETYQKRKERLCLAIVDNDMIAPKLNLGKTAQKVEDANDPNQLFCEHLILDVRMAENLLPTALYKALKPTDKLTKVIAFIEQLESINAEARRYFHFKKSLKLKEFFILKNNKPSLNKEDPFVKYWQPILECLNIPLTCCSDKPCQTENDKCNCLLTPCFDSQTLDNAIEFIEPLPKQKSKKDGKKTPTNQESANSTNTEESVSHNNETNKKPLTAHELAAFLDAPLKAEWNKIGQLITAWCCGKPILPPFPTFDIT